MTTLLCEIRKPSEIEFDEPTAWKTVGEFSEGYENIVAIVEKTGIYQYKIDGLGYGTSVEYRWTLAN